MGSNEASQTVTPEPASERGPERRKEHDRSQRTWPETVSTRRPERWKISGYDLVSSERLDLADRSFTAASNLHSIHPFSKKETAINGHLAASGFKLSLLFPRLAVHRICNR